MRSTALLLMLMLVAPPVQALACHLWCIQEHSHADETVPSPDCHGDTAQHDTGPALSNDAPCHEDAAGMIAVVSLPLQWATEFPPVEVASLATFLPGDARALVPLRLRVTPPARRAAQIPLRI